MGEISYQNKDIASKVTGEALIGKSLAPFGLPHLKIIGALPTNLPAIESNELRLDNLFLLSDGSLAIIDYESDFSRENFIKYLNYIARVLKRYSLKKELDLLKQIRMVVIYTADVECTEETYDLGGLILNIEAAYLVHMDSEEICSRISRKIRSGDVLSAEEMMELMILPLTVRGRDAKQKYIFQSVELAKALPNRSDTVKVLAGILTFSDKIIDKNYANLLKEEIRMTQVEQLLFDEAYEKAFEDARKIISEQLQSQDIVAFINMYRKLCATREETLCQLMEKYSLTESEGNEYLKQHWK